MTTMRLLVTGILLAAFLLLLTPAASAHGAGLIGSGVINSAGSFLLVASGHPNDTFHAFLSSLALPIGAGDTLQFSWSANNFSGPAVLFEIHAHPASAGYVRFYNSTASFDSGSWPVPGSDTYMVYWVNPNNVSVQVSYRFTLFPPPPYVPLVALVVAVGVAIWFIRRTRRRARSPKSP